MADNKIPEISLSADSTTRLHRRIIEMVEEAEEFHSSWEDLHDTYWRYYLGIPEFERKSDPWEGASNLFIPLVRVACEGVMAQEYDAMLSNEPFGKVISFQGMGQGQMDAELLTQFYFEWLMKKVIPFRTLASDYLLDNNVDGTSAAKIRWDRSDIVRREMVVDQIPRVETFTENILGVDVKSELLVGIDQRYREEVRVETADRPAVDVTDMTRIYMSPDTTDSLQWPHCPWYYEKHFLTWEELLERRRHGYENIDDALKAKLTPRDLSDRERTDREHDELSESTPTLTAEVLELYMRWPLPFASQRKDDEEFYEDIVVTFLWDTKKISRIVPLARMRPDLKRPHVLNHFTRRPRFPYGLGIPAKLRHIQEMTNSAYNQMMDYGTLQNLPFYFYEPMALNLQPDINTLRPGQGVPVQSARGVVFPRFQGDASFWLSALQQLNVWTERDSAVNDLNQGRNPSTPNAPRTFRGQAMMLQQSNLQFGRLVAAHAEALTEIFYHVHSLVRRYAPEDWEFKLFSRESGMMQRLKMPRYMLDRDVEFEFVLNPNRQAEQQNMMMLFNFMMQAMMQAGQAPQLYPFVRNLAKQVYTTFGKKDFDEVFPPDMMTPQVGAGMGPVAPQPPAAPPPPSEESAAVSFPDVDESVMRSIQ